MGTRWNIPENHYNFNWKKIFAMNSSRSPHKKLSDEPWSSTPSFWVFMPIAMIVGATVLYKFLAWFVPWFIPVVHKSFYDLYF